MAVIKHWPKPSWRGKGFVSFHTSQWHSIMEAGTWSRELEHRPWRNAAHGPTDSNLLSSPYRIRPSCLVLALPTTPPPPICSAEISSQAQVNLMEAIPQLRVHFPRSVKLTNNINYHTNLLKYMEWNKSKTMREASSKKEKSILKKKNDHKKAN